MVESLARMGVEVRGVLRDRAWGVDHRRKGVLKRECPHYQHSQKSMGCPHLLLAELAPGQCSLRCPEVKWVWHCAQGSPSCKSHKK